VSTGLAGAAEAVRSALKTEAEGELTRPSLEALAELAWQTDAALAGDSFVFLQQLRLEVYEEIYWRLAGGISREVMLPIEAEPLVQKRGT